MRTIIDLPRDQLEQLEAICRSEQISRAEAVRRAVALLVRQRRASSPNPAFGIWRDRAESGLEYQERLRAEWKERPTPDEGR